MACLSVLNTHRFLPSLASPNLLASSVFFRALCPRASCLRMRVLWLLLAAHHFFQTQCVTYDLVRNTAWAGDVDNSCYSVTDGHLVLLPGCFAALTTSGVVLDKLKTEEVIICEKFAHGEFFQLDFSIQREDSRWCEHTHPPPIVTTIAVNKQSVIEILSDYNAPFKSHTYFALLEDEIPLDVSFTSMSVDPTTQTIQGEQCISQIVLSNVAVTHVPQPCRAEVAAVYSPGVSGDGVLAAPDAAAEEPTDACALLGSTDAVILHKIKVSSPPVAGSPTLEITQPARVFCGIYTTASEHSTRIHTMRSTWGHKCTTFLAFSTTTDPAVPSVYVPHIGEEKYANMWQKIRSIWKYIYTHYLTEYDYFLLCGDDTFYIMENLYAYLNSELIRNLRFLDQGLFIGRRLFGPAEHQHVVYNSGGAGYLLDRRAVQILVSHLDSEQCRAHVVDNSYEDVNVARCLASADPPVLPLDTRDEEGEQRFHPFSPGVTVLYQPADPPPTIEQDWYHHYDPHLKYGMACCSVGSVSFHYLSPQEMGQIRDYLYHCEESVKREYYDTNGQLYFNRYRKYGQLAR